MIAKVAFQKIRKLAKRGSNEMLERAIQEVYLAGMEAGARALSEQLKGRINDIQGTDNGVSSSGVGGKSDSPEPSGSPGPDTNDGDRDTGGTIPTPNECRS